LQLTPPTTLFPSTTLFRSLVGDPEGCVADRELGDHVGVHLRTAYAIDLHRIKRGLVELDGLAAAPHRELRRDTDLHIARATAARSEEHTSELQSRGHLVCR